VPEIQILSDSDVKLAFDLAQAAGTTLLDRPAVLELDEKSTPTDIVTHMDKAAEALIVEGLIQARPHDGLLGEEGAEREAQSGRTWVIDPIDGTINYMYQLPFWCVSIGLVDSDGRGIVGVVHAPALNKTWIAKRDGGAWLVSSANTRRITVSSQENLAFALMGTGFGYSSERRSQQARVLNTVLPQIRDIRRLGSCAIDLCLVAEGQLDGFYEKGVHTWDHAAGSLIALEAGAQVSGLFGQPAGNDMFVATNPHIHRDLLTILESVNAHQD
jgi:myo-inositol-1(or 4)-monophosphatase